MNILRLKILTYSVFMMTSCSSPNESTLKDVKPEANNYPSCCVGSECTNCKIINTQIKDEAFSQKRFMNAQFEDTFAKNLSFDSCTLDKSILFNVFSNGILLSKTTFSATNLTKTNFKNGTFDSIRFEKAKISNSNWSDAAAIELEFKDSTLEEINLSNLKASTLILKNVIGRSLNLKNAEIQDLIIRDSQLPDIDFSGSTIERASIDGSDLSRANFSNAAIRGSFIVGTDLVDAKFTDTEITDTDFCRSSLNYDELDPTALSLCQPSTKKCLIGKYAYSDKESWTTAIKKGLETNTCNEGNVTTDVQCRFGYSWSNNACLKKPNPEAEFVNNAWVCPEGYKAIERSIIPKPPTNMPPIRLPPDLLQPPKLFSFPTSTATCQLILDIGEFGL